MKQQSLFGKLPKLKGRMKDINKEIINKANKPQQRRTYVARGRTNGKALQTRVMAAVETAKQMLKDDGSLQLITDEAELRRYINTVLKNGRASIDTETNGLDPILDKMVGFSIYTPGEKPAYIPVWHTDFNLNPVEENMPREVVRNIIQECIDSKVGFVFHNAVFDMRVTSNSLEIKEYLHCLWDTQIAGNLLNEIEPHGLDQLWEKYCNDGVKVGNAYGNIFRNIPFNYVPIEVAYLYAAFDAKMTWELYEFQEQFLNPENEQCISKDLKEVAYILSDIELPIIPHLCKMEDTGIPIDEEVSKDLSERYNKKLAEAEKQVSEHISKIDLTKLSIEQRSKLTNPINPNSPQQLSIIFYDALEWKSTDRRKPRGTGEDIIEGLMDKYPSHKKMLEAILEYRGVRKLLSTYIDKIPGLVKETTGRVHARFNQYGAKTGRFSSSDPNLQNIPSRNKEIRRMFIPSEGNVLIGADYSQQEPRVLAHLCMELFGDSKLMDAYIEERDLYSWMASEIYEVPYEECFEYKDGKPYAEGYERRESVKSIILGMMYGRQNKSIADQLGWTETETDRVVGIFFQRFPAIKQVEEYYKNMARSLGYVQTVYGRKRRLPEMSMPKFEIVSSEDRKTPISDVNVVRYYQNKMENAWGQQKNSIKNEARQRGIHIIENGFKIADAERQCLNSTIQGSSADVTKKAMVEIGENEELKDLGYNMLLTVHDEIIGEAPIKNAKRCGTIVSDIMMKVTEDRVLVPMKVEAEYSYRWFGEDISESLPV